MKIKLNDFEVLEDDEKLWAKQKTPVTEPVTIVYKYKGLKLHSLSDGTIVEVEAKYDSYIDGIYSEPTVTITDEENTEMNAEGLLIALFNL